MFRAFNSFQITALFAAFPFLINWLFNAEFAGAGAFSWVAVVAYIIAFVGMTTIVYDSSEKWL